MKIKQKQELKSSSMLALFCLVGLSLAIILTPWNHANTNGSPEKTLQRAEIVGYQLVQLYREASKNVQNPAKAARGPASAPSNHPELRTIGTMGLDHWGQPYHYRILSTDNSRLRVLIWSSGPDAEVESNDLENEDVSIPIQPVFAGDDVGLVMSMSVN